MGNFKRIVKLWGNWNISLELGYQIKQRKKYLN